ncbi:hypothetical protein E2C01_087991 [Portunus trituberculatus]|uniref:Uncharacterized protein n=1 Tax=Portunus trituberculatus TaxID=210409 RepID=A0A5B7JIP8_PORTR|nr:hypothetical protein [Portunus trituberculatus]
MSEGQRRTSTHARQAALPRQVKRTHPNTQDKSPMTATGAQTPLPPLHLTTLAFPHLHFPSLGLADRHSGGRPSWDKQADA